MRRRGLRAVLCAALMTAGLLSVAPETEASSAVGLECVGEVAQPAMAARMADDCDRRVEVTSQRTEATEVYVNPGGTSTVVQYAYPQRVKRADGGWSTLDSTLTAAADGTLTPRASAVAVAFSGGGSSEFARVRRDGGEVALSWPGVLPKPRMEGSRATYAEVLPGVDLVATARDAGFSFVLVVKNRKAARDPALRRLTLGTKLSGLRWKGTSAVNAEGRAVLTATAPLMWDGSGGSTLDAPGEGSRRAAVTLGVPSVDRMVIEPDADLLLDPKVTFPVVVDPTIGYSAWTMINGGAREQEYWDYDRWNCSGGHVTECAKVGYYPDGHQGATHSQYRSMFEFSAAHWQGKQVLDGDLAPNFTIDLLWSADCRADRPTYLHAVRSGGLSPSMNWNNTEGHWHVAVSNVSNTTCNGARRKTEFRMPPAGLAEAVNGRLVLGLKAGSETDAAQWKKFDATTARLIVNLNSLPDAPTNVTIDGKACATGTARPFVPTVAATVRATASDADMDTLSVRLLRQRIRDDGTKGPEALLSQEGVPAGTTAMVTMGFGVLDPGDEFVATGDWTRDGKPDVISRDPDGYLYVFNGGGSGANGRLGPRAEISRGWVPWNFRIVGLADWDRDGFLDAVARDESTAQLWVYTGGATPSGFDGERFLLSSGWGTGWSFAGLADWDRDGHIDVIARDGDGELWLYPGRGGRLSMDNASRVWLGGGWGGYTYFGTPDWDRDGKADIVARDPASGQLWQYPGNGTRAVMSDGRFEIGRGWGGYRALTIPDSNADGTVDIVALPPDYRIWTIYPGSGQRGVPHGERWTIASQGTSHGGTYSFRMYSSDGKAHGAESTPCEFTVDNVAPLAPSVAADVYKAQNTGGCGGACGSVGQTGRFTFASSADVTHFEWGFSEALVERATPSSLGGSVTIDWTPTAGGPKTLYVAAVDRAGNRSALRRHQFSVAAPTAPLARWLLNDESGETTVADDTGRGRTLSVSGGAVLGAPGRLLPGNDGVSRSAMRLDGVDDFASGPAVVDTGRSFSVSAWLKLDANAGDQAVIAQSGQSSSAFQLGYAAAQNRWVFTSGATTASSTSAVQLGTWTHVAGTYNSTEKTLRIYVGGAIEGQVSGATGAESTGDTFFIGKTGQGFHYKGSVAQVQTWNRVIGAAEAHALADPLEVSAVGEWHFEDVGSSYSTDSSNFRRHMTTHNGAQIVPTGPGPNGGGLSLDGSDDYAETESQILRTDQSFTISAWVRLKRTDRSQALISQGNDGVNPSFSLHYGAVNGGEWVLGMQASATATDPAAGTYAGVRVGTGTDLTDPHHLVGVFDAQKRQLRLYVDGNLRSTAPMNAAWRPWDAPGPLRVGAWPSGAGTYADAEIDEVRALQGAVSSAAQLYQGTNALVTGERLTAGQDVNANIGGHQLVMQGDGNLVKYRDGVVQWASDTQGNPDAHAVLQPDGNFVVYDSGGTPLWSTETNGTSASPLVVEDDGKTVLYGPGGQAVWTR